MLNHTHTRAASSACFSQLFPWSVQRPSTLPLLPFIHCPGATTITFSFKTLPKFTTVLFAFWWIKQYFASIFGNFSTDGTICLKCKVSVSGYNCPYTAKALDVDLSFRAPRAAARELGGCADDLPEAMPRAVKQSELCEVESFCSGLVADSAFVLRGAD